MVDFLLVNCEVEIDSIGDISTLVLIFQYLFTVYIFVDNYYEMMVNDDDGEVDVI